MVTGAAMIGRALGLVGRLVLPPRCAGCGAVVDADGRFCAPCWGALRFIGPPWCAGCCRPFAYDRGEGARCGPCSARAPVHAGVRAAVAYDDRSRALVLRMKYGGRVGLAHTMARPIARLVPDSVDLLVAVPLHRRRLWSRGFNQAVLIADAVARETGRPVDRFALERVRHAPSTRGQDARARARAVRGAFRVPDPARVAGRHLGLVDDVHTTGATADAASRALLGAGALSVTVLCWARVLDGDDA